MAEILDKKNKQILNLLDLNARIFITDISKKAKLNKDVVKYRMVNLERDGIIQKYYTLIDVSKLGYSRYRFSLNLMNVNSNLIDEIKAYLVKQNNVNEVVWCDVVWDLVFIISVKKEYEIYNFLRAFKSRYIRYIESLEIEQIYSTEYFPKSYAFNQMKPKMRKKYIIETNNETFDLDERDKIILIELEKNSRISLVDLSKKLHVDSMSIKRRILSLEKKGVIIAYPTEFNYEKMNLTIYNIRLVLLDFANIDLFENFLRELPNVIKLEKTIGRYDLQFTVIVNNYYELEALLNSIRDKFQTIREIIHFNPLKIFKYNYTQML